MSPTKKLEISPKIWNKFTESKKWGAKMAYIMGKNGLTLGQKESNFKNQQFIVSHCQKVPKTTFVIGDIQKVLGEVPWVSGRWSGPIGLKAKDPYWGGMGI